MKLIFNTSIDQELRQLKSFVKTLFPEPNNLDYLISAETQQQELVKLRIGRRPEQFFFVVDFVNLSIISAYGLEEIGYNSNYFSFHQYLSIIPTGSILQLVMLLGKQTFILSTQAAISFLKPQFIAYIPINCMDGRVMLTKRTISPWQITDNGQITAYLSEFVILKPYENEPMNPRFTHLDPVTELAFNRLVARLFANLPAQLNLFSPKEMVLLKLYIETGDNNLTAKHLSKKAGITVSTFHTHNKNIILKAKAMFGDTLPTTTAQEVAIFLKKCGLIG